MHFGDGLERDNGQITKVLCMYYYVRRCRLQVTLSLEHLFHGNYLLGGTTPFCMFSSPTWPPGFAGLAGAAYLE